MSSIPACPTDGDQSCARAADCDRAYSYAEAIEVAGNGKYNYALLLTLSMSLLGMALDMFSFSLVVSIGACDLQLNEFRKNILVLMPFVGSIIMAFAWGYISDTRGRRSSLLVAMSVSFVVSTVGAFSPHWAMLAVCRLVSTCFCSCAQSATYTLIGESCPERVKGAYMLVMTSVIHLNLSSYYLLAYLITTLGFSFDLGFISFVPWRLLILILALPLGISALLLLFSYESPKFLLNAGRKEEALDILKKIYRRNGEAVNSYPVQKIFLGEAGNLKVDRENQSLLQSMWQQTTPLFKPPLLANSVTVYSLIFALYSSNSALLVWLPFFAESFSAGIYSDGNKTEGLCEMIYQPPVNITTVNVESCTTVIGLPITFASITAGVCFCILSVLISKMAAHRRVVMITVFSISFFSGVGNVTIHNNISSLILFFGFLLNGLNMGVVFSYCVDLYPTSFRGMAACLGVMVARLSGIAGVNATGPYIRSHCNATFYALSFLMLSAAVISFFLPRDKPKTLVVKEDE